MADETFQIGDIVVHKAENASGRTIQMTVHGFINPNNSTQGVMTQGTNWVLCQWFNTQTLGYQQTRFHINELQKIA